VTAPNGNPHGRSKASLTAVKVTAFITDAMGRIEPLIGIGRLNFHSVVLNGQLLASDKAFNIIIPEIQRLAGDRRLKRAIASCF
jgi:hypothetical protein